MDEPTSGLDPLKVETFNSFLREERESGTTVFFSSHILGEVRRVCDRVGIIREGKLVALEDIDSLLKRGGKRVVVHAAEGIDESDLTMEGIVDLTTLDDGAQFTFAGDYNDLLEILADYTIVDLQIEEPPLEDVFMHFYGAGESDQPDPLAADDGPTEPPRDREAEEADV